MATIGSLLHHVLCFHVIFNSQPICCAPGRPKAPVAVRPRWNSGEPGDVSSGLLPYLIVFVIFPISLMLLCICAKYAVKWCSRHLAAHPFRGGVNPHRREGGPSDAGGFRTSRIRTISGGRHSYTDLRSLSGFFSFRPSWQEAMASATSMPTSRPCLGGGRRGEWADDPPPSYPVEEPPPSYESLFDKKRPPDGRPAY